MVNRDLAALAQRVDDAAAAYRAALGAGHSVTGRAYDDAVRAGSLRLIEAGRHYEREADRIGLASSERLRWTGYLLTSSAADAPMPERAVPSSAPDAATLVEAALEVVGYSGDVDEQAWQVLARDDGVEEGQAMVTAGGQSRPGLKTAPPAVAEIAASRQYRDALRHNLEVARAWVATTKQPPDGQSQT